MRRRELLSAVAGVAALTSVPAGRSEPTDGTDDASMSSEAPASDRDAGPTETVTVRVDVIAHDE
jgi:hypothetical protein